MIETKKAVSLQNKIITAIVLIILLLGLISTIFIKSTFYNIMTNEIKTGLSEQDIQILIARVVGKILLANSIFAVIALFLAFGLANFIITNPISEIADLILKISAGNFDTDMKFGPSVKCWEIHNCSRDDCPAYKNTNLKCWYTAGTFCRDGIQGTWAKKLGDCKECEVYQKYCGDEIQKLADAICVMGRYLKEDQEKLVRTERLAAIGTMASGIGHELRNPLGAIRNASYYIKGKVAKTALIDEDPHVAEFLDIIENEIEASGRIINNLLLFTRIGKISTIPSDINQIIEYSLPVSGIPENVSIVKEFNFDLPKAMIDPDQIRQVFINIIKNACDAMPEGGNLHIKTTVNDNNIEIEFTDTGAGIKRDELDKIFEPLYTTKTTGFGLGLAITKAIVEKHAGRIKVKSEPGKLTTFKISLPIKQEEI